MAKEQKPGDRINNGPEIGRSKKEHVKPMSEEDARRSDVKAAGDATPEQVKKRVIQRDRRGISQN